MPCNKGKEKGGRTGKEGDSSDAFRMHRSVVAWKRLNWTALRRSNRKRHCNLKHLLKRPRLRTKQWLSSENFGWDDKPWSRLQPLHRNVQMAVVLLYICWVFYCGWGKN